MCKSNAEWLDDARGTLETLVSALDALPETFETTPEIGEILEYINVQCRAMVKRAGE